MEVVVPIQSPLQPEKIELPSGEAVRATWVPCVKLATQVVPQLIVEGLVVVTVPVPLPALFRVSVKF
jgi:hypothetical protein